MLVSKKKYDKIKEELAFLRKELKEANAILLNLFDCPQYVKNAELREDIRKYFSGDRNGENNDTQ